MYACMYMCVHLYNYMYMYRHNRAACCHPVCLISMLSTSWEKLDELQAGIKIRGRNINNLRYVDDITLIAEIEEELKILVRVKEDSEKASLKLNIKKN